MGRNYNLDTGTIIRGVIKELNAVTPVTLTPSADGLGTGQIPANARYVALNAGADADAIVTLPAPVLYKRITIFNASGTGFELRTTSPTTIGINGGVGAAAESALAATALRIELTCISLTNWIAHSYVAAGTESAVQVAA